MTYTESRNRTYFLSHDSQASAHAQANTPEKYCTCLTWHGYVYGEADGACYCYLCQKRVSFP